MKRLVNKFPVIGEKGQEYHCDIYKEKIGFGFYSIEAYLEIIVVQRKSLGNGYKNKFISVEKNTEDWHDFDGDYIGVAERLVRKYERRVDMEKMKDKKIEDFKNWDGQIKG